MLFNIPADGNYLNAAVGQSRAIPDVDTQISAKPKMPSIIL
jgi:hypothetical protein